MGDYIDVHTHLLPGLDDGSESPEESLAIVRRGREAGFRHFVCTPHVIKGAYDNDYEMIYRETEKLQAAVREAGIDAHVFPAAENFMDDYFFEVLEGGRPITYRPWTADLLIETPFLRLPEYMGEVTFRMQVKRYQPILAHPERYDEFVRKPKRIAEAVESGYRIQLNLGSFGDLYGRDVRKAAEKMLKMDVVDFVGSDVHSQDQADFLYGECLPRFVRLAGPERAEKILHDNPAALLSQPRPARSA